MPRLDQPRFAPDCAIRVDGRRVPARAGESITSALLAAGRPLLGRSPKYHRPRGPFCLASSCASCLVRVDGVPNVRACETPCRDGLAVETQNVLGAASLDLLGAIDLVTPHGLDHHHLATWGQLANRLAVSASRRLAGLGRLSHAPPAPTPPAADERFDAVVVGAGPAGLGAAAALAGRGARVLLCDREPRLGGRLRCRLDLPGDPAPGWADEVAAAVESRGGEAARAATALGLWPSGPERLAPLLHRGPPARMRLVRAPRWVLCTGTWAQPPVFEGNDLPGIFSARGLLAALAEDGVVPGERAAVLGEGPEAAAVAARLGEAGMAVERITGDVLRARGGLRLGALLLGGGRRVSCDTLAVATPRLPAADLAREAGASLDPDAQGGGLRLRLGPGGTVAAGVLAAGELCGPCDAAAAADAGRRAGEAAHG